MNRLSLTGPLKQNSFAKKQKESKPSTFSTCIEGKSQMKWTSVSKETKVLYPKFEISRTFATQAEKPQPKSSFVLHPGNVELSKLKCEEMKKKINWVHHISLSLMIAN